MGSLERAKEHIRIGKECGLDAVKFQLLEDEQCGNGNIELEWDLFPELKAYGNELNVPVFASAFSDSGIQMLYEYGFKWLKLAHSMRKRWYYESDAWDKLFISWDYLDEIPYQKNIVNLFCIPEYPVLYDIPFETFQHIFKRFDGFSSHCLGTNQEVKAIGAGAKYLEVHFMIDESDCPDGKFAKTPDMIEALAVYSKS